MVAQYSDGTRYFTHKDHLGTTRLLARLDKSVHENMDYLPFGEQVSGGSATTHKFTGKERDGESGLDYFGARYYASSSARFLSPDPYNPIMISQMSAAGGLPIEMAQSKLREFLGEPSDWNRYAYVRNNPLRFVDPSDTCPRKATTLSLSRS